MSSPLALVDFDLIADEDIVHEHEESSRSSPVVLPMLSCFGFEVVVDAGPRFLFHPFLRDGLSPLLFDSRVDDDVDKPVHSETADVSSSLQIAALSLVSNFFLVGFLFVVGFTPFNGLRATISSTFSTGDDVV